MNKINFEEDRVDSVTQIDQTKTLSDKVIELRNLEDQVAASAQIEVTNFYSAKISPEKQEEAFSWLRDNGLGDIIKNDITVTFGRGEDNKASEYATLAKGQGYEPVQKVGVHPQTLKAVVRERVESGQDMPTDLFNTFVGNQTKINRRK